MISYLLDLDIQGQTLGKASKASRQPARPDARQGQQGQQATSKASKAKKIPALVIGRGRLFVYSLARNPEKKTREAKANR